MGVIHSQDDREFIWFRAFRQDNGETVRERKDVAGKQDSPKYAARHVKIEVLE